VMLAVDLLSPDSRQRHGESALSTRMLKMQIARLERYSGMSSKALFLIGTRARTRRRAAATLRTTLKLCPLTLKREASDKIRRAEVHALASVSRLARAFPGSSVSASNGPRHRRYRVPVATWVPPFQIVLLTSHPMTD
jgi:hypothetical protein